MRFTNIDVVDQTGSPIQTAMSGQTIVVRLQYKGREPRDLRNVSFSIGFYGIYGQFLLYCGNEMVGKRLERVPSSGTVLCEIPKFPLAPGHYEININCEVNGILADWVPRAYQLVVVEGDFFGTGRLPPSTHGGLLVPQDWRLSD